jgi:RHS repeat-associated protein
MQDQEFRAELLGQDREHLPDRFLTCPNGQVIYKKHQITLTTQPESSTYMSIFGQVNLFFFKKGDFMKTVGYQSKLFVPFLLALMWVVLLSVVAVTSAEAVQYYFKPYVECLWGSWTVGRREVQRGMWDDGEFTPGTGGYEHWSQICGLMWTPCTQPRPACPPCGQIFYFDGTTSCDLVLDLLEDCFGPFSGTYYCEGSDVYTNMVHPEYGPSSRPPDSGACEEGDPVDPYNGMFVYHETDIGYPSPSMARITRSYSSGDTGIGPFGRGTSISYDHQLPGIGNIFVYITPERGRYTFSKRADGSYTNNEYPFLEQAKAYLNADDTRELIFQGGSTYTFDSNGRLIEEKDKNGNYVTVSRDSSGNITGISDSFGRSLTITTTTKTVGGDTYTLIASVSDALGNTVYYDYDASARLTSVTLPDDNTVIYSYDANGRIATVTNPRGIVEVANTYGAAGRVESQSHIDEGVFHFSYTTSEGVVTETMVTEPEGNTKTYKFNNKGYVTGIVDAYGHSTTYQREAGTNRLLSVTDALQRTTTYTYDANGNVASITDPAENVTNFSYDLTINKPTQISDALGNVTTMSYDTDGNLVEVNPPGDDLTTISYDASGLPLTVTNALYNSTTFDYDSHGMITNTTDPVGNSAVFSYDAAGRLTGATDPESRSTLYSYDAMGRITSITDALSGTTTFTYDAGGNLLSVTDAKEQTVSYAYDTRGRVSSMTDQLGNSETYGYDKNDNLTSVTDRKGQTTTYTYDLMDRMTRADYADSSYTTYTYDEGGRLTAINDSVSGQIGYTYTNTGCSTGCSQGFEDKVAQETTPLGTINYEYDALGRRTSMTVAGQPVVTYGYDANSHLTGITRGALSFGLTYDAVGRRTRLSLPSGAYADYGYDPASRLTELVHKTSAGAVIDSFAYTYDGTGNRLSRQTQSETTTYQYDALYRLLQADSSVTETYTYDPVGNRLSSHISDSYAYNTANRLLSDDDYSYEYDANGNLISDSEGTEVTTLAYDARSRLIRVTMPDGTVNEYAYDALGRRTGKEVTVGGETTTTRYLYDGLDIVQELDGAGAVTANYVRSLNIDEPLARIEADGTTRYYHSDALGSVTALTDASEAVQTRYKYESFGKTEMTLDDGHGAANPFRFTGRELDETGIYYYRARYYNPEVGRFISEDPIRLAGGINFYSYVGNSPQNFADPLGLTPGDWWDARTYLPDLAGARSIADEVRYIEAPATGLPGAHNGPQDAWRHARWNQRMVEEIGWGTAIIAGYGHELEQLFSQPWSELLMDLHNNREGRRIANTGKTPSDLLNEGRLRTINPPCKGKGGLY